MEDAGTHEAVFLETGLSHKDNVAISDWITSGVDDIFIYDSSRMVLIKLNDGNELWLVPGERKRKK